MPSAHPAARRGGGGGGSVRSDGEGGRGTVAVTMNLPVTATMTTTDRERDDGRQPRLARVRASLSRRGRSHMARSRGLPPPLAPFSSPSFHPSPWGCSAVQGLDGAASGCGREM